MGLKQSHFLQQEFPNLQIGELLEFSKKYLISSKNLSFLCRRAPDESGRVNNFAFPAHARQTKITKINKNIIVIHYCVLHTHYFRYYDCSLNFIRERRYQYNSHVEKFVNIHM